MNNSKLIFFYYLPLIAIIGVSFWFYAPCFYGYFNSDHAIHVLMSTGFELPRDIYYWGQNRLGSLLPFITYIIGKIIPIHPLYLISIVQYSFLALSYKIISDFLKNNISKLTLAILIFLPITMGDSHNDSYNALLLIGHPYSSQLFTGVIYIYFLSLLKKTFLSTLTLNNGTLLICTLYSFFATLFYLLGIWVSEFNAILILIPVYHILITKEIFKIIKLNLRKFQFWIFTTFTFLLHIISYLSYIFIKSFSKNDFLYDKAIIDNFADVNKNFSFFINKFIKAILFKDSYFPENLFYCTLLIISGLIIYKKIRKKFIFTYNQKNTINALLITTSLSIIFLFLSTWNLRSEFIPRYFTPVYIIFCFTIIYIFDIQYFSKKSFIYAFMFLLMFSSFSNLYKYFIFKDLKSPFEKFNEFCKLEKGCLMGDYWRVYAINAVAVKNLSCLPTDDTSVRNYNWRNEMLKENNIYFFDNEYVVNRGNIYNGHNKYIFQYGQILKFSGKQYICNAYKLSLYHKLTTNLSPKFIIKSSNNKYLKIDSTSRNITATESKAENATIFEFVWCYYGRYSMKTQDNKYLTFYEDGKVSATADNILAWEEIYVETTNDSLKVNFRNYHHKYLSINILNDSLIAKNENNTENEKFTLIKKN